MSLNCCICKFSVKPRQHSLICKCCKLKSHRICIPKITNSLFYTVKSNWKCDICINAEFSNYPNPTQKCCICSQILLNGNVCFNCNFPSNEILDSFSSTLDEEYNISKLFELEPYPKFNKGIRIGYLNTNGMQNKISEIRQFLQKNSFDAFACAETKLKTSHTNSMFEIDGYNFIRLDRTQNNGGGTCMFINRAHKYHEVKFDVAFPEFVEVIPIKIYPKFRKPFLIISVYKPPYVNYNTFLSSLDSLLFHVNQLNVTYFLLGDFNINLLSNDNDASDLICLTKQYSLDQLISNPTRVTENTSTLIDHLFTNSSKHISQSSNFTLTNSDHDAIFCVFGNKSASSNTKYKLIKGRSLKKLDWEIVNKKLSNLNLNTFPSMPPDNFLNFFEGKIMCLVNEIAPFVSKRVKNSGNNWLNSNLIKLIHQRNLAYKNAKLTKNSIDFKTYKNIRNACNIACKNSKRDYFISKFSKNNDSKSIWLTYNELSEKQKSLETIDFLTVNGQLCSDKATICDEFANKFFPNATDSTSQITAFRECIINDTNDKNDNFSACDIVSAFGQLKKKSSNNEHQIPLEFFNNTIHTLKDSLSTIFSGLYENGIFPENLKHAIVTPLYKGKGAKYDALSFRPISVLPLLSKLYEKLLHVKVIRKLESDNKLDEHQHGFRSGRSCQTALYNFSTDIFNSLDKTNTKVGAIFVDMVQAFSYVPHLELLKTLHTEFDFNGKLLRTLCHYFLNRSYSIKLGDFISKPYTLGVGVVQGSILGPSLYNCYYNQVYSALIGVKYCIFADDLVFYLENSDEKILIESLRLVLNKLDDWCNSVNLSINFNKTKMMIFHKSRNKVDDKLQLMYNNQIIERVSSFKYLGVFLDEKMTFKQHALYVKSKLSSAIGCLNFLKKFITEQMFITLINCFVFSIVDYGLPVWGFSCAPELIVLQKKIDSFMKCYFFPKLGKLYTKKYWSSLNSKFNATSSGHRKLTLLSKNIDMNLLYEKCNVLCLKERLHYYSLMTVFNTLKFTSKVPQINNMFRLSNVGHDSKRLLMPNFKTTLAQHSVQFQSIKLWNIDLPREIRECKLKDTSASTFSELLTKWCMSKRC